MLFATLLPAQEPTPLATFPLHGERLQVSRDERFALLEGLTGVLLLDLHAAAVLPLPDGGPWQAGAFDATGQQVWLVDAGGTARGFALQRGPASPLAELEGANAVAIGVPKVVDAAGRAPRFHDLAIATDGAHVAWSIEAGDERIAGVHAVATGTEVARFRGVDTAAMSDGAQPWIAFLGQGAHVVVQVRARRGEREVSSSDGPGLMVWELAAHRPVARFEPYAAANTPGYALLPDGLVVGIRRGLRDWPIVRWRIGDVATNVQMSDARGGHFTDLHAEPGGHIVCEWDFEDEAVHVLDPVGRRSPKRIAVGHAFVGFASPATATGDAAGAVLARGADGVLRRFAWDTGEPQGELAVEPGFRIAAARWNAGTRRVLGIGRLERAGNRPEWQARLWSTPAAGD